jgi:excinuclease ABC subunit A
LKKSPEGFTEEGKIFLKKVRVHNLKSVDLTLNPLQLIVFTGVSGSGKSSLAFDTIYVEGQRRYIESLSTYARRHLGDFPKPDAELISGISPTIAIEQKTAGNNPRSTVGTLTGIYDYLRVLYARVGTAFCPVSKEAVKPQSTQAILRKVKEGFQGENVIVLSPYIKGKKGEFKEEFSDLLRKGFTRVRLDGQIVELSEEIKVEKQSAHTIELVIDRLKIEEDNFSRLTEAITQALEKGSGMCIVLAISSGAEQLFSQNASSAKSGLSYPPLEPQDFSFNHPSGMCPTCQGLGVTQEFDLEKVIDPDLSIAEGCFKIGSAYTTVRYGNIFDNLARLFHFSVDTPWKKLKEKAKHVLLYGTDEKWTPMHFIHPEKKTRWTEYIQWRGVLHEAKERFQKATSQIYRENMQQLLVEAICPSCLGVRIKPYPAAAQVSGKHIWELTAFSIQECRAFFEKLELPPQERAIAEELIKEIRERLSFLIDVGLHYLTLERTAPTLSGGEAQRVRLSSQIGSGLVGATYILDEPSIGLHPRDNLRLLQTLQRLRDQGNTVIIVEHDEETIALADEIVDVGPLAGQKGGHIVAQGSLGDILKSKESLTGAYLSGRRAIAIPKKRKAARTFLTLEKAAHHNLKNISAKIPLGLFVGVTGVSGSGKSSLITDTLYPALSNKLQRTHLPVGKHRALLGWEALDKVIAIDQSPIGRTPRSNPATYIKLFDEIRALFSELPESQAHGFKAGRFSFNMKEGSCPHCGGMGMTKIDMDFLEDEWIPCLYCEGKRFDERTLSVHFKGKNIYDILKMPVSEAFNFFEAFPKIKEKLETLLKVGLDYLELGQPSPTLSGGEAQRIKLAKELSRPATGKTFYILDEPTTGLHFYDIEKLIHVLQELVKRGNSVLVIEHNMDLIKTVDWVIDLGPEGGDKGGEILGSGSPEKIAKAATPTGIALKKSLRAIPLSPSSHKERKAVSSHPFISIKGASQNNLKGIDVEIPRGKISICTGPSGSGKSSLAFETVYAEGQRRYSESLSPFARQFIKQMPKPKVESVEGLSASIAIEQKNHAGNPRSTLGTMTEIYDFLRILYAHLGVAYCPDTKEKIETISKDYVLENLLKLPQGTRLQILSLLALKKQEAFSEVKERLQKLGFLRIRLNGRYHELDEEIAFDPKRKNALYLVIDRLIVKEEIRARLLEAIDRAASFSKGSLIVDKNGEEDLFFNLNFAVVKTGKSYPPITPHTFSFNTVQGMCLDCQGLGFQYGADLSKHKEIMRLNCMELLDMLWKEKGSKQARRLVLSFLKKEKIDQTLPLKELESKQLQRLFFGSPEGEWIQANEWLQTSKFKMRWIGLNHVFVKLAKAGPSSIREEIAPFLDQAPCLSCGGTRLNALARHVLIEGLSIADFCGLSLDDAHRFLEKISLTREEHHFLREPLEQIKTRLHFLIAIGLSYLSLDRSAPTLSGGETQRLRLGRQLGTGLKGCLYVLDEPTIGLHPHDNANLNAALRALCDLGNTLLLVEHDPLTLASADYLFDFGPGAGKEGGKITAQGTLEEIKNNPLSLTGAYLSGRKKVPIPKERRSFTDVIAIEKATLHNLKGFSVDFPLGVFTCITGVSGSGKSTLMNDLLRPMMEKNPAPFDKLLVLDQNPIGTTNRADVSTYVDLLTPLRTLFAELPEAKMRGLLPKHFSFNHPKGMCRACWGHGVRTVALQFLPPVKVTCDQCLGFRLNPLSLQVTWKGKHLGHILQMNAVQAKEFLPPIPKVVRILETLLSVGLGYLVLGQEVATLSGGEAGRLRLSRELAKRIKGRNLYLFDEPTIGLHSEDILKLLAIFHALVEKGHTLIVIEHNLDVIANADYLIDLGPGAGKYGGHLVATGTPEAVSQNPDSLTGQYLFSFLNK